MLDWRQLTKLKSTYTDALQAQINPETGRVHTSYSLAVAQTGRLALDRSQSAEHPDPHRDRPQDPRRLHRRAGPCADERRLQPDRAAARRAHGRRSALKQAFADKARHPQPDRDRTVRRSDDRDTRDKAKTINFAILYGISSLGAGRAAGRHRATRRRRSSTAISSASRASATISRDTLTSRARHGFTTTLFGRKTHFPNIRSSQIQPSARAPSARRSTRRSRAPAPTSSSGRWRGWTRRSRRPGSSGVRMLLQVHDELVFEVPEGARRKPPR